MAQKSIDVAAQASASFLIGLSFGPAVLGTVMRRSYMKGISRRTRACAALAATGALALTGTASAQDHVPGEDRRRRADGSGQHPDSTASATSSATAAAWATTPPALTIAPAADGSSCATSTTDRVPLEPPRRAVRLLRGQRPGQHRAVRPRRPADQREHRRPVRLEAVPPAARQAQAARAGWHGSLNESQWPARVAAAKIIGLDYIGTGNGQADGTQPRQPTRASCRAPRSSTASASTPSRTVSARSTCTTTRPSSTASTSTTAC